MEEEDDDEHDDDDDELFTGTVKNSKSVTNSPKSLQRQRRPK